MSTLSAHPAPESKERLKGALYHIADGFAVGAGGSGVAGFATTMFLKVALSSAAALGFFLFAAAVTVAGVAMGLAAFIVSRPLVKHEAGIWPVTAKCLRQWGMGAAMTSVLVAGSYGASAGERLMKKTDVTGPAVQHTQVPVQAIKQSGVLSAALNGVAKAQAISAASSPLGRRVFFPVA